MYQKYIKYDNSYFTKMGIFPKGCLYSFDEFGVPTTRCTESCSARIKQCLTRQVNHNAIIITNCHLNIFNAVGLKALRYRVPQGRCTIGFGQT